jgi:NADP-dependent 3-hydroxy acid dehydrogenase YdfG
MESRLSTNRLSGKVAIVTGASSGIGKAVARDLAKLSVKLVLVARRKNALEELQHEIKDSVIIQGDITDTDMPDRLLCAALDNFGRCDIVIHAAGVLYSGSIDEVDIDDMCRMSRINFEASVRITYRIMKYFKKTGSGHFVHLSSILGTKVRAGNGVYAGTKYAIEALVEALRMELAGTQIKVSAVEPGVTITELHNNIPVHPTQALGISTPLQPEDVASCIRFILDQPDHVRIPVLMILPGEQAI